MSSNVGDRSWMYDRLSERGRLNRHFVDGVEQFVEFAFSQGHLLNGSTARCPCFKCGNRIYCPPEEICQHLYKWGFVYQYHTWSLHGEEYVAHSQHVGQSSAEYVEDRYRNMVDDAFGGQFGNENYNIPTEETPNGEAKAFFELLRASETPVNLNGDQSTVLQFVSEFLTNKISHTGSTALCDKFIKQVHRLLSPEEKLRMPHNMYSMKKLMKGLGLGYETFDVCVNNCFLYYGEFESDVYTICTQCHEPRYEERQNPNGRKLVSCKKLWYLPLTPRLQRLYMSRATSEHMTWHLKCQGDNDRMIHPAAGEAWKVFDETYPDYAAEARNVRLGICTDGFTPYGSSSAPYSCWPVFVTPYNLPPDLCMRQEYIFLSLIISGPKSPGKNIDVLLRPLIDELRKLWVSGVETYDSFRKQNFQMRASVLWTISDFPAYGMLSQWSTHGRLSCPYCMEDTKSFQLKHGRKTSFFDCHRRFLPLNHPWRNNRKDFYKGRKEEDRPLSRRTGAEMKRQVCDLPDMPFGNTGHYIEEFGKKHNWCRRSIFWELPYWETNLIRHNLDVMHCEKNFFDNIKNTVMDDPDKTKDKVTARRDLEEYTRRKDLFFTTGPDGKIYKPKAIYCLERDQKELVCEWLTGLRFPDGYASNISRCVQMQTFRLTWMKSHDCHVFMQRLVPIAFRDFLPDQVWGPLVEVSNFFRALCATEILRSDMELLERSIVETMCKLEKIFPPSFFDSMEHLAIHLPWEAKVGGPVQYRWMYPFERRMFELKKSVGNKARVEGSICETYLITEIANFCSHYFESGVQTRQNQLNRNETQLSADMSSHLSIFQKKGKPIGGSSTKHLTTEEFNAAHLYVVSNCSEADCWMRLFYDEQCYDLNEHQAQQKRNAYFLEWFKDRVNSGVYKVDPRVYAMAQGPLRKACTYNGYRINGFRFHTEEHGLPRKTMNSGVCVKASTGDPDETNFYGMLQEVVELEYWCGTIVLFKCDWYDSTRGTIVHPRYRLVDINHRSRLSTGASEPYILANQAQQVYYSEYPSKSRRGWWAVCTTRARHIVDMSAVESSTPPGARPTPAIYQENEPPIIAVPDDDPNNPIQLADPVLVLVESDDDDAVENEINDEYVDDYEDGFGNVNEDD